MVQGLECWKCGATLQDEPLPLRRVAECKHCHADLHVCRLCDYFEPRLSGQCREPVADPVQDKTRANFCGYFQPRVGAYQTGAPQADPDREALEALFGGGAAVSSDAADQGKADLEALFGDDKKDEAS